MHAWYLPCDLHFFIMAVILVMGINKNRTIGLAVLYFVTFLSVITPGIITYIYELKPTVIFYHEWVVWQLRNNLFDSSKCLHKNYALFRFLSKPREDATFELLYIKSHTRATVYLLGIITGYILHVNRNSKKRIPLVSNPGHKKVKYLIRKMLGCHKSEQENKSERSIFFDKIGASLVFN